MAYKPSASTAAQQWSDLRFQLFEELRDHGSRICLGCFQVNHELKLRRLDQLLSAHLITRSAHMRISGGIVTPICLAVLRLITNSSFVGRSTGSSLGLAPLRILSTKYARRRNTAESDPYDIRPPISTNSLRT